MTQDQIWQALILMMAGAWTPGPNNAMLSASAARFGFRATQPHAWGVAIGFGVMMFLTALGLGQLFIAIPALTKIMLVISVALLLFIAWKIASSPVDGAVNPKKARVLRPFRFIEAAGFQWINPKAWMMAIGVIGAFPSTTHPLKIAVALSLVTVTAGITSSQGWSAFGTLMGKFLSTPTRRRVFNLSMAALIVLPLIGLVYH